jgi:hypothetical protein
MARGSSEVWAKRVARWKASGLRAKEFARREKLNEVSLKWWKWKLGSLARTRSRSIRSATSVLASVRDSA